MHWSLYFEKDIILFNSHRHDWEFVVIWTIDGKPTHIGLSHHRSWNQYSWHNSKLQIEGNRPKIVYHNDGGSGILGNFGHPLRLASKEGGWFSTPPLVSYYSMSGDGACDNREMRFVFDKANFGEATNPMKSRSFMERMNNRKKRLPAEYPEFEDSDLSCDIDETKHVIIMQPHLSH